MKKCLSICGCKKDKVGSSIKSVTSRTNATDNKLTPKNNGNSSSEKEKEFQNSITPKNDERVGKDKEIKNIIEINNGLIIGKEGNTSNQKIRTSNQDESITKLNKEEHHQLSKKNPSSSNINSKQMIPQKKTEEIEMKRKNSTEPNLIDEDENENEKWLIPKDSRLICPYEKGEIEFSPNGLGRFLESLDELKYVQYYNKNNLEINIRKEGSPLTSKFLLFRSIYTQKKSELGSNANASNLVRLMYEVEERAKWDKTLKLYKRYEGNDNAFVIRTWCHKIVFFISEREGIEKRFFFTYKNVHHVFASSVNEDVKYI